MEQGGDPGVASGNGDRGGQAWPGVGGLPPLTVTAETLKVRFVSSAAASTEGLDEKDAGAWGFRLTACGREVRGYNRQPTAICPLCRLCLNT